MPRRHGPQITRRTRIASQGHGSRRRTRIASEGHGSRGRTRIASEGHGSRGRTRASSGRGRRRAWGRTGGPRDVTQSPLPRLFTYSRPYRPRFIVALAAMLVYAGASAVVAYLIKPIINKVLPGEQWLPFIVLGRGDPGRLSGEGSGLVLLDLPDDRHRPAGRARPAQSALRPHPESVGRVLRPAHHRPVDVAHHQRRQPGAAGSLGDDRRSAARGARRWSDTR